MKSIRLRIVLTLLACLAVVLAAGGAGVYFFTRTLLLRDFDLMLRSMVPEVVASVREQLWHGFASGKELKLELGESLLKSRVSIEVWTPEGRIIGRTASLPGAGLHFPSLSPAAEGSWRDEALADGTNVRGLVIAFRPAFDYPGESPPPRKEGESPTGASGEKLELERAKLEKQKREERFRVLPPSAVMLIARDRSELNEVLQRLSLVLWTVGTLTLLVTAMVVALVTRRGLAPLQQVGEQAARIDASKLDFRFPTADLPEELKSICERLNDLLARLEASFARERCFSADVAHELRTPISELRLLAEIALKWPAPDPVVGAAFRDTLQAALQMQGIVEGLLAIARCEAGTQPIIGEPVNLAELVRRTWQPFESRAAQAGLSVELELSDRATLETDRSMLGLILTNLFSNAVEYAPRHGTVQIRLQAGASDLDLTVANTVENLAPGDLPHLFERFWRKDTARSSSEHSGIGLSVSQAYARKLGLNLAAGLPRPGWLAMRLSGRVEAPQNRECEPVTAS